MLRKLKYRVSLWKFLWKKRPVSDEDNKSYMISPKGLAVIAAIESGLMPEIEGGYDDTKFEKFWRLFAIEMLRIAPPIEVWSDDDAQQT